MVSRPWDFPLFLSPSPGPPKGSDTPTLHIPAPFWAPRGSHSGDTTWLLNAQGAGLVGTFHACPRWCPTPGRRGPCPWN